jgi:hypothetical protein
MVLGLGASPTTNICVTLYGPNETIVAGPACTDFSFTYATSITQKLTTEGLYTIDVTETSTEVQTYYLSLERLAPEPPDAIPLLLDKVGSYKVTPPTAQDAFTFNVSTTGTFEITASLPSSASQNVCIEVYNSAGTSVAGPACTDISFTYSVSVELSEPSNGTYVVVVSTYGNDATVGYNIELGCPVGICTQPTPKCFLSDSLSYSASSSTLIMNFTVGTPSAATWDAWLVDLNDSAPVAISGFPQSLPVTEPAKTVTVTQTGLAPSGKVGVLSTLITSTQGVTCSSWQTINTGTPQ